MCTALARSEASIRGGSGTGGWRSRKKGFGRVRARVPVQYSSTDGWTGTIIGRINSCRVSARNVCKLAKLASLCACPSLSIAHYPRSCELQIVLPGPVLLHLFRLRLRYHHYVDPGLPHLFTATSESGNGHSINHFYTDGKGKTEITFSFSFGSKV
jgi:hypothetical protein